MTTLYALLFTLITLAAAAYAQWRIPFHTANARHARIGRVMLLIVGVLFGIVMASVYTHTQNVPWLLAFLSGFGVVHVPAAAILFLKRQRAKS
jgi:hypothetical protein